MTTTIEQLESKLKEIKAYFSSFIAEAQPEPFAEFYSSLESWLDDLDIDDTVKANYTYCDYVDSHSVLFMDNDEYDIPLLEISFLSSTYSKSISVVSGYGKSFTIEESYQVA